MNQYRINPSSLQSRNSRYVFGGLTESSPDALGWWERYPTAGLVDIDDAEWQVTLQFAKRPDLIASAFYGTPSLCWLILQHNNIIDVEEELVEGTWINIPDPNLVRNGLAALRTTTSDQIIR